MRCPRQSTATRNGYPFKGGVCTMSANFGGPSRNRFAAGRRNIASDESSISDSLTLSPRRWIRQPCTSPKRTMVCNAAGSRLIAMSLTIPAPSGRYREAPVPP